VTSGESAWSGVHVDHCVSAIGAVEVPAFLQSFHTIGSKNMIRMLPGHC
jgi:hypothetical protein